MSEFITQIPIVFASGLISVLSPCVMPLMPAYLSLISGVSVQDLGEGVSDGEQRARVMEACVGFVCGFSTVFIVLGASAFALGRVLRGWQLEIAGYQLGIAQLAGVVIIVFGLHMMGAFRLSWLLRDTRLQLDMGPPGFLGSYTVGAGFGFGWSPLYRPDPGRGSDARRQPGHGLRRHHAARGLLRGPRRPLPPGGLEHRLFLPCLRAG